jgi:hypothetical protein
MKKRIVLFSALCCLLALATAPALAQEKKSEKKGEHHGEHHEGEKHKHKFKIAEVEKFHDLLAPIWHEQYPAKEWAKIRAQGGELVRRKDAVMKVRLRTKPETQAKAEELRQKFGESVDRLAAVAKSGTDDELQKAVAEMHEAFENFFDAIR